MFKLSSPVLLDNPAESRRSFASTAFPEEVAVEMNAFHDSTRRELSPDEEAAEYQRYLTSQNAIDHNGTIISAHELQSMLDMQAAQAYRNELKLTDRIMHLEREIRRLRESSMCAA